MELWTPLHCACVGGHPAVSQTCLIVAVDRDWSGRLPATQCRACVNGKRRLYVERFSRVATGGWTGREGRHSARLCSWVGLDAALVVRASWSTSGSREKTIAQRSRGIAARVAGRRRCTPYGVCFVSAAKVLMSFDSRDTPHRQSVKDPTGLSRQDVSTQFFFFRVCIQQERDFFFFFNYCASSSLHSYQSFVSIRLFVCVRVRLIAGFWRAGGRVGWRRANDHNTCADADTQVVKELVGATPPPALQSKTRLGQTPLYLAAYWVSQERERFRVFWTPDCSAAFRVVGTTRGPRRTDCLSLCVRLIPLKRFLGCFAWPPNRLASTRDTSSSLACMHRDLLRTF